MVEKKRWGGARPGSGRKPTGIQTMTFQVRLRKQTVERLKNLAEKQGKTAAGLVRQLIEHLTGG